MSSSTAGGGLAQRRVGGDGEEGMLIHSQHAAKFEVGFLSGSQVKVIRYDPWGYTQAS